MNTTLQPLQFQANEVRVVTMDGMAWFVLTDLCGALDISNSRNVAARLNETDVCLTDIRSGGQMRSVTIVIESGMWDVVLDSSKPAAKAFRRWVTSEVLPSIRKTGGYSATPVFDWTNPVFQRQMLESQLATMDRAEAAEAQLAIAAPKAAFAGPISASCEIYDVRTASNLLEDEGFVFTGRNTLFRWMRDQGWVAQHDRSPLQSAITAGYLKRKYYEDGYAPTTLVTAKGLARIHRLMLAELEDERMAGFRELPTPKASATKKHRLSLTAA